MKKILSIILLFVLLIPSVSSTESVVSSRTDQELKDMISLCSKELRSRLQTPEGWTLIFDHENVQIYQIGDVKLGSHKILTIPVAIINNNDFFVSIYLYSSKCNGWEIDSYCDNVSNNAKKKGEISFWLENAFIESIDDIVSLEFIISLKSESKEFYREDSKEYRFW